MILAKRHPLFKALLIMALLGNALHFLEHPMPKPWPSELGGPHFGVVATPDLECPLCGVVAMFVACCSVAVLFLLLALQPVVQRVRFDARAVFTFQSRAPPR